MKALVTGGAGGIGRALVERLARDSYAVEELDLATGFDVADPAAWERVGAVDLACLNAGVTTATSEIAELPQEEYRRVVAANVDGVVLGVRRLARVCGEGSAIVATASLAGLTAVPLDPIYALSKHAVVGFVRSAAPQLAERGIRLAAVAPGFADTPMVDDLRETFTEAGFPLLSADDVVEAILLAARGEPGAVWFVQPGREPEPFRFPQIPGPRSAHGDGPVAPPL